MNKTDLLLVAMVGFLAGIFEAEFFRNGDFGKMAVVVLFVVGGLWQLKMLNVRIFVMLFLGIALGFWRFMFSFELPEDHLARFLGQVEFEGCIVAEVDVRAESVRYVFEVDDDFGSGKVLVVNSRYPEYGYGDCFTVKGLQLEPGKIEDFDYGKYLSRYDLYSVIYRPFLEPLSKKGGNFFMTYLLELKRIFESRMEKIFAEPHGSFMAGLILGSRSGIPEKLMMDFNTTGLTHIIAISGYNITLIIVIVSGLLGFVARKKRIVVSIFFVIVFVIFVGASAAVVRAGIMGVLSLVALWFGRQSLVTNALIIAAFVMNLWNPKILVYDVGFQLSFLATCGLVYCSPMIEKYFQWLPKILAVRESVLMTMSAQIFALPVIVYNFGRLSLVAPMANLFVLPFVPLAMLFGFLAVVLSFLNRFLGMFVGFIGYLILELVILFVKIFASVPMASTEIDFFPWWLMVVYYWLVLRWILKN